MTMFRDLKVKLTQDEWEAYASQLANVNQETKQVEAELQAVKDGFKGRLTALGEREYELAEKVRNRQEVRAVEVYERPDERRFVVELYRGDTGELLETRPMSSAERHAVVNPKLPGVGTMDGLSFYSPESLRSYAETLKAQGLDADKVDRAVAMIEEHGLEKVAAALRELKAMAAPTETPDGGKAKKEKFKGDRKRAGATEAGDSASEP
jgi:hypothetical protein